MSKFKQIIFLGAGASASDGAPIQSSLFKVYFNANPRNVTHTLHQFFLAFYGIDLSHPQEGVIFPSFEEVLGILEISLSRGESFNGYSIAPASPDVQRLREELIFLIAEILKATLQYRPRTNHDALVSRLRAEGTLSNTSFISLNYDILIDNSLTDLHDDFDLDYGLEFANYFDRPRTWHAPRKSRSVKLLKLHGSLNWLYCPTCTSIRITPKEKSVSTIANEPVKCGSCETHMAPIIIPPTFFKAMSNFHLQRIWRVAEEQLAQCDQLVFCGYSFPDADVHIKYLMKRMEVNGRKSPQILIFNHHEEKLTHVFDEEKIRFEGFFRKKDRVSYLTSSFEDFCQKGIP